MKVAFDFDDCLVDFVGCFLKAVNRELNSRYTREDVDYDGWSMGSWASSVVGEDWLEWFERRPRYWLEAETLPGALETLWALDKAGHELELLTSKPRWAHMVVWNWLVEHHAPFSTVRILDRVREKHEASDADIIVDDRPETVRDWNSSSFMRFGILFARVHNEGHRSGLYVAESHADVLYAVQREEMMHRGD